MKKILVVFTGGTIGSVLNASGERDIDSGTGALLIGHYYKNNGRTVEFETCCPYSILSENCNPSHWGKLVGALKNADLKSYAGVIITHGSDTLPFSAALTGFIFGSAGLPIILVASNHPLEYKESNGHDNFANAVKFILHSGEKGVFVIYRDSDRQVNVYLGTRLEEQLRYGDTFTSFGGANYGQMRDGVFVRAGRPAPQNDLMESVAGDIGFGNRIIAVKSYPGLDYTCFNLHSKVKAVLCVLYHSSTWCNNADSTGGGKYYLKSFFDKCKKRGVDMYLCSFKDGAELYRSCGDLIADGAVPLKNISFEAAYMKLNIAYNQTAYRPLEFMRANIFAEYTE